MKATECNRFCNYHCCTDDCPNIQYDAADQYWGFGIADDIGLKRVECKDCIHNDKRCTCEDCYFMGSSEVCPKTRKEKTENADN